MCSRKKVGQISTLGLINDNIAQGYMTHIMQRLELLLESREWYINHLKEFYPRSLRLLGLNVQKGKEICIRFRVPGSKSQFLPFSEVMCTVLHELVHCVYSRHDKSFWEMYGRLVAECEVLEVQLLEKGIPLYPDHIGLVSAFVSCPEQSVDGTKRNRKRQNVSGGDFLAAESKRRHAEHTLQNCDCSSFHLSGHRLGGGAVVPPTSADDRRALFAAKARQRQKEYLPQWCRNEREREIYGAGAPRDLLSSEWSDAPQENSERYFICGCRSSENSSPESLLPCRIHADVEQDVFSTELQIHYEGSGVSGSHSLRSHSSAFSTSCSVLPARPRSFSEESLSLNFGSYGLEQKKELVSKTKSSEEEPSPQISDEDREEKVKTTSSTSTKTITATKKWHTESFSLQHGDTAEKPSKSVILSSFVKDTRNIVVEIVSDEDEVDTAGHHDSTPLIVED